MPSILETKARRVLRYLNKHGFNNIKLTVYIMDIHSEIDEIVRLEQYLIDSLKSNLNVDLIASGSGYHSPMSEEARSKLRSDKGTKVYIYDSTNLKLLYVFESKQEAYNTINIHHTSLNNCLDTGELYLGYFYISLDIIESDADSLYSIEDFKEIVAKKRELHIIKHPKAKNILAEFKDDSSKNLEFPSLNKLAEHLKGDRQVIRQYLRGDKVGYYRGV